MKKFICMILVLFNMILLTACRGEVSKVNITHVDSDVYTAEDIDNAVNKVLSYFKYHFDDCTMTELHFAFGYEDASIVEIVSVVSSNTSKSTRTVSSDVKVVTPFSTAV